MTAWSADGALVRRVGDAGLLIEFDAVIDPVVNARAVAVADALRRQHPPGVRDVVPTFRSVAVHFDPLTTDVSALEAAIRVAFAAGVDAAAGARHEIPVVYGGAEGPDLEPLATSLSLSPDVLVGLHAEPDYRVYMLGFLPGFAYLGVLNPRLDCPRHRQPRLRVPPGSVGLAGRQTGVYPQESPGGWQLVGRTATRMFDPDRPGATLVAAGDTVRFVRDHTPWPSPQPALGEAPPDQVPPDQRHVTILAPGLLTTVQDAGRWGSQDRGVPVAGAMDAWSRRVANAVVGNPASAAVLEATVTGPALRFEQDTVCAVTGADLEAAVDGVTLVRGRAYACRRGAVLRCGERRDGARAYIACDGGFSAPGVMGSRSTHRGSRMGGHRGRALHAGDVLTLGAATVSPSGLRVIDMPRCGSGARLRVLPGPQEDWFDDDAWSALTSGRFEVSSRSERMGYRLAGPPIPLGRARRSDRDGATMISDATFPGAIQVTPAGEAVLLMADRQTTGGYPQMATVISADLPRAGQLAPGDWVAFEVCRLTDALAALVAQESQLLALE